MKKNKLDRYETKIEPEITPEMHKANCAAVAEILLALAEKVEPLPVAESFDELLAQLKNPQRESSVIVQTFDGERVKVSGENTEIILDKKKLTLFDTGAKTDTDMDLGGDTFTDSEKLILEQFQK
jgi:hypothetical protein